MATKTPRGVEFRIFGVSVLLRKEDHNGLTCGEREAIEPLARKLRYENLDQLLNAHGYNSAREIATENRFRNVGDFFLAGGWMSRVAQFTANGTTDHP